METIILGAGITGLSAGIKTGATIYEASDRPGGICRSYSKDGYRFENGGGHWIFGSKEARDRIRQYVDLNNFERAAGIYFNEIKDYPIQSYDKEGFFPSSFKGWLFHRFGIDLCKNFFWPFNNKYTAGMFDDIIQDDPGKSPNPGRSGYNSEFSYPNGCGLDVLVDRMANDLDIKYNKEAVSINAVEKVVQFQDGSEKEYDRLISTLPLKSMMRMCGRYKDDLPHTSVLVLNIGAEKGPKLPKKQWLYVPGPDQEFFRVGFYSNVDPSFAPDGKVSIYVERAIAGDVSHETLDITHYVYEVCDFMRSQGWIEAVEVCDPNWIEYAYTWLKPGNDREGYLSWLDNHGIKSIGRYGRWKFQGIAESIEEGFSV